nr:FAD-dependent oxidoreductase [Priestia koreensis]
MNENRRGCCVKVDVAIVGAGMVGVMAASVVQQAGKDVLLIDKGKSVGGRMATRRVEQGKVDHGAQFFTVRTEDFQRHVDQWVVNGQVKEWFGDPYKRYCGTDGMNGFIKYLAKDVEKKLNTRIVKISKETDGWLLYDEKGEIAQANNVIFTPPAPQIIDILKDSREGNDLVPKLQHITFNPCFVAILKLHEPINLSDSGHLDEYLPDGMERMVDHQAKGISSLPTVSIYMEGTWSKKHYEENDDTVLQLILEKASTYIHKDDIEVKQLKRWRYAEAKTTLKSPFINQDSLYVAGDAFLHEDDPAGRTRVESAFLSGIAVGNAVLNKA